MSMKHYREILEHYGVAMDKRGREILDDTPLEIPIGFKRPETLAEQIRRLVRSQKFADDMSAEGQETFEEADDFEVGEDYDPSSPYEMNFDQENFKPRPGDSMQEETPPERPPKAPKEAKGVKATSSRKAPLKRREEPTEEQLDLDPED